MYRRISKVLFSQPVSCLAGLYFIYFFYFFCFCPFVSPCFGWVREGWLANSIMHAQAVKLHYFSSIFSREMCVNKRINKIDQLNNKGICLQAYFMMGLATLLVFILRYGVPVSLQTEWYIFLHPPGWPLSEIWQLQCNGVQFIPNIKFCFLSQIIKVYGNLINLTCETINLRKKLFSENNTFTQWCL